MVCLGTLLLYIALARPPAIGWALLLIALGVGALVLGMRMHRSTSTVIELTRHELRDSTGMLIAPISDIANMDRGFFAFKPSNGFLLRTKSVQGPRVWRPGMWWRFGKQVGIGGVTPGSQTKFMSEMIAALLAERDGAL